ncbi:MAG TPA: phosphotransferase [Thermomicrobiales bacterium]|nr:phosphotransferase [Thermomicrobiales bacterium]
MPSPNDLDHLSLLLQRTVPDIGPVVGLEHVAEGYGATTLRALGGLCIRIPHSAHLALKQNRTATALHRLAPLLPVPTPVPLWTLPVGYPFETGAIGYQWIDGEQPDPETSPPSLAEQVGRFLATLHGIDGETLDTFDGRVPGPADVAAERDQVMGVALPWLWERQSAGVMDWIERWWASFRAEREAARYELRLVHGDFWHGNLLADASQERLTGVIDWEQIALDDQAQDLATLLHGGTAFSHAVLATYRAAGGTVDAATIARRDWLWGYREFTGIALALEFGDEAEALDGMHKLQQGALRHLFITGSEP